MLISTYHLFYMKSMMLQPIHLKLTPSNLLLGLLAAVSIVSCAAAVNLPIPLKFKFVIIALIIISSAYFILRDALLRLSWSWQTLEVNNKGVLTITNKRGQKFQPTPAPHSFIHAACTILNFKRTDFKCEGFKLALPPLILFANAENTDELRHLRVWLRWFKHQGDLATSDLAA
jgi:hypothetical protein